MAAPDPDQLRMDIPFKHHIEQKGTMMGQRSLNGRADLRPGLDPLRLHAHRTGHDVKAQLRI